MKNLKTILVAILSMFILNSGFGQAAMNQIAVSPTVYTAGDVVTLKFYVTWTGTPSAFSGDYVVCFGYTGSINPTSTSITCGSWYLSSTPGVINFTIPSTCVTGSYRIFVEYVKSPGNTADPSVSTIPTITVNALSTGIETVSVKSTSELESIYPVPANKDLNFKINNIKDGSKLKIIIYSIEGKKVSENDEEIVDGKTKVDVSTIPSGIYLIEANAGDLKFLKKVVIVH